MSFSPEIIADLCKDPVPVLNRGYRAKERIPGGLVPAEPRRRRSFC